MAFSNVRGTVDYYPDEMSIRKQVFNKLSSVARRYGFQQVDSPVIESQALLKKKQGEEIIEQLFVLKKKSEEDLALRAEFTPSLARMYIDKQKSIPKPVKWFCIDRVFRYERPQAGRLREFFQYNVELYGARSNYADAEIINLAVDSLKALGLTENDFKVKLNNRRLIQGLLLNLVSEEKLDDVMRIIDKRTKIDESQFKEELKNAGVAVQDVKTIIDLLYKDLSELKPGNLMGKEGLEEVQNILECVDKNYVSVDLSVVRGLAYYTGMVFEIFDKQENLRSICGGGRYDNMIELFGGEVSPAVGFGMGYSTLYKLLELAGKLPVIEGGPDYFVAAVNDSVKKEAYRLVSELRKKHVVEHDLMNRNIAKQMNFANKMGAHKVVIVGPEEIKNNQVKVKDMKTGEESLAAVDEIVR